MPPDPLSLARDHRRLVYVIDVGASALRADGLLVEVATQKHTHNGEWSEPRQLPLSHSDRLQTPDVADREIAQVLLRTESEDGPLSHGRSARRFVVRAGSFDSTLRRMAQSGRAFVRLTPGAPPFPVAWDDGAPWDVRLALRSRIENGERWFALDGRFVREAASIPIDEPDVVVRGGLFIFEERIHRFVDEQVFPLLVALRTAAPERMDSAGAMALVAELHRLPRVPAIELPEDLPVTHGHAPPVPVAAFRQDPDTGKVEVDLLFAYGGTRVPARTGDGEVFDPATTTLHHRDADTERAAQESLLAAGLRQSDERGGFDVYRIDASIADDTALDLARSGWEVTFDGAALREALDSELEVRSGIDWFELHADVDFGGVKAGMPELLAAVQRGSRRVRLADGSSGILPEDVFARLTLLATTGRAAGKVVRYKRSQVGLLDALLAAAPAVRVDESLARIREELQRFSGVAPADPTAGFVGTLREYQREGLGWLHFLRQFGFGGCLADDMGLGKTVQALALIESRRAEGAGPSLVVVPNSLVFNWQQEAARFTPQVRVLIHTGVKRRRDTAHYRDYDLVITTYGTLRRDAPTLARVEFDYVILDEAQAIKNASTDSAKAARLLRARHRLAMSGTPVENRLAELWSLLDFLNPGMLGSATGFGTLARVLMEPGSDDRTTNYRELLARAVRPYVLRRTKEQVAPELPEKLEQTLFVDLSPEERTRYNELRDHYRGALLQRVGERGLSGAHAYILEALLRLRQAACHQGLIDPLRLADSSSKLEVLESQIAEAVAEGHKVLVFSQFTSLLAIVRRRLDETGVTYEYLDGQTMNRQARVERFQRDAACPVFLISLKAGGLGLNLTAADYVILLDPWWNPAVESQAIDRTHRIGQTRRVFATRLIARDTVEEKVIQLQERKRDLADAIIRADEGPLARLTREELVELLSA